MQPRFELARRVARKHLRTHAVTGPPVPVEYILVAEGYVVRAETYPDDTAGESWWENGTGHVCVNRALPPGRLRFTLAHELGHLALRHHPLRFMTAPALRTRPEHLDPPLPELLDPIEVEANAFAAELLLPRAWFERDWAKRPEVWWIAERYEVSREVVEWRRGSISR
jgi:Zn-dependent peptidase ImmA (M78 family)